MPIGEGRGMSVRVRENLMYITLDLFLSPAASRGAKETTEVVKMTLSNLPRALVHTVVLVVVLAVIDPNTHAHCDHTPEPLGGSDANKLMVILLDGFRWDTVPEKSKGFQKMYDNGVRAKSMQPCFPTVSFTNYYCIMTGRLATLFLAYVKIKSPSLSHSQIVLSN